jgi:hypothetical protein
MKFALQKKFGDFKYSQNYSFHVIIDYTFKSEVGFFTDIIFRINGMFLVFILVKNSNNIEGIIVQHKDMNVYSKNKIFRSFLIKNPRSKLRGIKP